jgi:chromate reductase, NAD(P)H dehydrogenase (quinone)
MNILAISGSLRANSSNSALLEAARLVAPAGITVTHYTGLAGLPPFNPDHDGEAPPDAVVALRAAIGRADALLVSSPEYAHGIPGTLKNMLDWLVASAGFPGKPVALINASPRAQHAKAQLVEILSTMNAVLAPPTPVDIPLLGRGLDAVAIAADPELRELLRWVLAVVVKT